MTKPTSENRMQLAKELHSNIIKRFPRRRVLASGIDKIWGSDLVIMSPERGYKYILTIIDVFSKHSWVYPLKTKTGTEMVEAFQKIFKESGRIPNRIWADHGKEYYNKTFKKLLDDHNIELYSTESEVKCSVAERFNRTLKDMMYRKFTELDDNKHWLKLLPELVNEYNHRYHSTIKMTPIEGSKPENEKQILEKVFSITYSTKKPKFKVNDYVRIYKYKALFKKGYLGRWTKEVFKIVEVLRTDPVTYVIMDKDGEVIKGSFYEQELLKSRFDFTGNLID